MAQRYDQGLIVRRLNADRGRLFDFSFVVFLSVGDVEQDISVLRSGFRIEQPLPGILEVLCPDFLAVAPLHVIAEMEDDFLAAVLKVPRLGDDRRWL